MLQLNLPENKDMDQFFHRNIKINKQKNLTMKWDWDRNWSPNSLTIWGWHTSTITSHRLQNIQLLYLKLYKEDYETQKKSHAHSSAEITHHAVCPQDFNAYVCVCTFLQRTTDPQVWIQRGQNHWVCQNFCSRQNPESNQGQVHF